jgi:hypothetical protein
MSQLQLIPWKEFFFVPGCCWNKEVVIAPEYSIEHQQTFKVWVRFE